MNQTQVHRGPDEGDCIRSQALVLVTAAFPSWMFPADSSRFLTKTAPWSSSSTGKSIIFRNSPRSLSPRAMIFAPIAIQKLSSMPGKSGVNFAWTGFAACLPSALWDRNREILFLARDRLGIKPLYYSLLNDGTFIFASELKALLAHPGFYPGHGSPCHRRLFCLWLCSRTKNHIQAGIQAVPAHITEASYVASVSLSRANTGMYHSPARIISVQEAEEELIVRLRESVKIHLMTEVPLGAFLSGGVDSSAVVAMMADLMEEPVNTCSISFGDPAFNESQYAQKVADRYHTQHNVEQVDQDDFDLIDKLASLYDEPFADSSAMPTYRVCELARKRVTVALSGDGGDENLAGYRRYRWHLYEERMRIHASAWISQALVRPAGKGSIQRLTGRQRFCARNPLLKHLAVIPSKDTFMVFPS